MGKSFSVVGSIPFEDQDTTTTIYEKDSLHYLGFLSWHNGKIVRTYKKWAPVEAIRVKLFSLICDYPRRSRSI